jgi:hypothetical protein
LRDGLEKELPPERSERYPRAPGGDEE